MAENNNNWLDDLDSKIDEMLCDPKKVKFNTHKNRKLFFGELKALIKDAVHKNTMPIPDKLQRHSTPTITRLVPDKQSEGFAVMTEGRSSAADDIAGRGPSNLNKDGVERIREKKAGMRTW